MAAITKGAVSVHAFNFSTFCIKRLLPSNPNFNFFYSFILFCVCFSFLFLAHRKKLHRIVLAPCLVPFPSGSPSRALITVVRELVANVPYSPSELMGFRLIRNIVILLLSIFVFTADYQFASKPCHTIRRQFHPTSGNAANARFVSANTISTIELCCV